MKVHIDPARCQGHTLCYMGAPDLFDLSDDDGHAYVLVDEVPAALAAAARDAEAGCPERAITVTD